MVFADASVLMAILRDEPDAEALAARLDAEAGEVWISPVVRFEVVTSFAVAQARAKGRTVVASDDLAEAERLLDSLLVRFGAREVPITPAIGRLALDAAARYGKLMGHPARLNMGAS